MKKNILLLFLLLFCALYSKAQKPLTNSRKSSKYTYFYRLDDKTTLLFLRSREEMLNKDDFELPQFKQETLKDPVAQYLTDHPESVNLAPGNYLKVTAIENELHYNLVQKHNALLVLFENGIDTRFIVTDNSNNEINDAVVYAGKKQIPYDAKTQTYHIKRSTKDTLLKVSYKGINNFYALTDHPYVYRKQVIKKTNFFASVWKAIKTPFINLFKTEPYTRRNNPGFIVFNKPKYRPGDTVKFKAFILQRKSKLPVEDHRLAITLRQHEGETGKIIGYVNAYRKGGFDYQFKLRDSLEMKLDNSYQITLDPISTKKPAPSKYPYPSPQSPDPYISGRFRYEDYELKSTRFDVRVDKTELAPGLPATLYFKATDENGLNVPDGRVNITLVTSWSNDYADKTLFIPDTLWQHQIQLDPVGETKLVLPDSIFAKAQISFSVHADFLNSNNESQKTERFLTWNYKDRAIDTKIERDSIKINYLVAGKSTAAKAWLSQVTAPGDTINKVTINLPAALPINHAAAYYNVTVGDLSKSIFLNMSQGGISLAGNRTADSLFIRVNNPLHLKFWYTIFAGNKIQEQGTGTELYYAKPFNKNSAAYILLNYVWGGMPQFNKQAIPYQDKKLNIDVKQPITVYPGQQATVEVDVTDNKGHAVAGADITAYSFTRKFDNYELPTLPSLSKTYPYKPLASFLTTKRLWDSGELKLNWKHWSKTMGLDSMLYYQFTHTESVMQITEDVADQNTQVAPFVVKNGDVLPIHLLYIDEIPVYFSQTQTLPNYSFMVSPGKHNIRFRTTNKAIRVEDIDIPKGKKTILAVNADSVVNIHTYIRHRPDSLENWEADAINKYLVTIVPNFDWHYATLEQEDRTFLINYNGYNNYYGKRPGLLAGPFYFAYVDLHVKDGFSRGFYREGGYSFELQSDLVKQTSLPTKYPFSRKLNSFNTLSLSQNALTPAGADTVWQNYLDERQHNGYYSGGNSYNAINGAKFVIAAPRLKNGSYPYIKSIIIFKNHDPNYMEIRPGGYTDLGPHAPDKYRVFYLFKDNSYYLQENLTLKPWGTNYFSTRIVNPHVADSVSIKIAQIIRQKILNPSKRNADEQIKQVFNGAYMDQSAITGWVTGKVFDYALKKPVNGAAITVVNTTLKTTTDAAGKFKIKVPKYGALNFSYPNYQPVRVTFISGEELEVSLVKEETSIASSTVLRETEIRGYVKRSREQTTGSSYIITGKEMQDNPVGNVEQLLQGKVAGLNIQNNTGAPGMRGAVNIRGLSAAPAGGVSQPLYVVDGVITDKSIAEKIDSNDILSMSILKDNAAIALYGERGAAGVIVITTKKGSELAGNNNAQTLRHNFNDYAYWQPQLTTDADGKAKFKVTYPDDITNWRTFVIGITDNKQTGFAEGQVKSFKPISANFVSPLFAVQGDSFRPIGKVMNYTTEALKLNRKFTYNNKPIAEGDINVINAHIDTFKIVADVKDSLTFEYAIKRDNGYFDGEKRSIPVFEKGTLETKGAFDVLEHDTTITLQFNPALKEVTLTAESSILPVLLDETEHLRNYEYLCNEQLASKLKGLLAERRIRKYLGQPFKWDKDINVIIKKLNDNRTKQGTWGWWRDTDEELWISYHVIEALADAETEGFKILVNKQPLIDYLMYRLTIYNGTEKLTDIATLKKLGAKADFQNAVTGYEKSISKAYPQSEQDKLMLMYTRQSVGMPIVIDSLLKKMQHTMFGNVYWGKASFNFFNNSIPQSLLAYRILKGEGKHPQLLTKLRNYFMEMRRDGNWRNTYESAQILETILPDLLIGDKLPKPAQLKITGDKTETVTTFPYTIKLNSAQKLSIAKTGDMPVYFTAYQKIWNANPPKVSGDFTVDTWFENGKTKVTGAKGGEAITLTAEVTVKADADFVMIEIPIPAGCSYESKDQGYYYYNEVHREYFKNKVNVFCRRLATGKYRYTIKLMPRYGGSYTVNPARAEMMYFPVFYGREAMKQFDIN